MKQYTASGTWLNSFVAALDSYGIDGEAFLAGLDINFAESAQANVRIPLNVINILYSAAISATEDECFGLTVGGLVTPHTLSMLGTLLLSASTLKESFQYYSRYRSLLVTDNLTVEVFEEGDYLVSQTSFNTDKTPKFTYSDYALDAICGSMHALRKFLTSNSFHPVKMELSRRQPRNPQAFEEFFSCPIVFDRPHIKVYTSVDVANQTIPGSSREQAALFEQAIQESLLQLDIRQQFIDKVLYVIAVLLPHGNATLDAAASRLCMSRRTLSRKLHDYGTNFGNLLRDYRIDRAHQYFDDSSLSLEDISDLLGFSSCSNFTRAFKGWSGVTPKVYRADRVDTAHMDRFLFY
jgi:AraC-like DNA-binding protein